MKWPLRIRPLRENKRAFESLVRLLCIEAAFFLLIGPLTIILLFLDGHKQSLIETALTVVYASAILACLAVTAEGVVRVLGIYLGGLREDSKNTKPRDLPGAKE